MRVRGYLLRSGSVKVIRDSDLAKEFPLIEDKYASYVNFDSGIVEDWPSVVRFTEAKVWTELTLVGRTAHNLETHPACKQRVYVDTRQRYNVDGTKHDCPKSTRKK